MNRCSPQPGMVSMRLETKLKKSLPSTFKRAIGQKSEILVS